MAGEYGAVRIYEGQMAVLGKSAIGPQLAEMKQHEVVHLQALQTVMPERRVRPTVLLPIWHVAGYALGTFGTRASSCSHECESCIGLSE
jgi:ubiquinone biosynthesis monooxygenase Coq7